MLLVVVVVLLVVLLLLLQSHQHSRSSKRSTKTGLPLMWDKANAVLGNPGDTVSCIHRHIGISICLLLVSIESVVVPMARINRVGS